MKLLINPHTFKRLELAVSNKPHAIGITGEMGAGKGYIAKYLGTQLLNIASEKLDIHPYVHAVEISDAKDGIDKIRLLQNFLKLKVPGQADINRVVIVENIDKLGHEAQNALLKTLEEPPHKTVIIVTYLNENSVLSTISSRLQNISVLPITESIAIEYYTNQSKQEVVRATRVSGGLAGLLTALLSLETNHPLNKALLQAREVLTTSRFNRMASIDAILKNKDIKLTLLLDGIYRLLNASYKNALKSNELSKIRSTYDKLALTEQAINDLNSNVQSKLVLSRLFYSL